MEVGLLSPVLGRVADVRYPLVIWEKASKSFLSERDMRLFSNTEMVKVDEIN